MSRSASNTSNCATVGDTGTGDNTNSGTNNTCLRGKTQNRTPAPSPTTPQPKARVLIVVGHEEDWVDCREDGNGGHAGISGNGPNQIWFDAPNKRWLRGYEVDQLGRSL